MTIKEKILAGLKTKFAGVEDSILNRVADKLAKSVTTEEQVASAVEGVTFQQVLQSYGDSRATEAQQSAVKNYEAKYGLKDGEKTQPAPTGVQTQVVDPTNPTNPAGGTPTDTTNALLQQLLEQNKQLTERLNMMDGERTTATRKQQLSAVIDKLPESLRKGYSRISVENLKDEEFSSLLSEVTTEVEGIVKDSAARGAAFGRPAAPNGGTSQQNELSKEQQEAIAHREHSPLKDGAQPF